MAVSKNTVKVIKKATPVKKAVAVKNVTSVKKTVRSVSVKKTAAPKTTKKEVVYHVNMRLTSADKLAIQKMAQKAGKSFSLLAIDAIQNRINGNSPVKKYRRNDVGNRDAVVTCRMTSSLKKKAMSAAKKAAVSASVYILDATFGQY